MGRGEQGDFDDDWDDCAISPNKKQERLGMLISMKSSGPDYTSNQNLIIKYTLKKV